MPILSRHYLTTAQLLGTAGGTLHAGCTFPTTCTPNPDLQSNSTAAPPKMDTQEQGSGSVLS